MPCNCDHMHPSKHEAESKKVANLIVYVLDKLDKEVPASINIIANDYYGSPKDVHTLTAKLCSLLKELPESILYNGRVTKSRELATWWEAHQLADKAKLDKINESKRLAELKRTAEAKLTPEELEAIKD